MDPKQLKMVGLGVAVAVLAAGGVYWKTRDKKGTPMAATQAARLSKSEQRRQNRLKPAYVLPVGDLTIPLRPIDKEILDRAGKSFPGQSLTAEDVMPTSLALVTLYKEKPEDSSAVRNVRVDLERNNSFDENWELGSDGSVTRDVTAGRSYHDVWVLDADVWRLKRGLGATAGMVPHAIPKVTVALRPIDRQVLELTKKDIGMAVVNDAIPGAARVGVRRPVQSKAVSSAEIDLDRDGNVDEVWSLRGEVMRRVSPADNGDYTEDYILENDKWVRKF